VPGIARFVGQFELDGGAPLFRSELVGAGKAVEPQERGLVDIGVHEGLAHGDDGRKLGSIAGRAGNEIAGGDEGRLIRPVMGARTSVYSRSSRAVVSSAVASAARARRPSASSAEIASVATSFLGAFGSWIASSARAVARSNWARVPARIDS